ncbi:MAG: hypothetical protein AB9842_06485 [Bacteroidales bacterium]
MKKFALVLVCIFFLSTSSKASHFMGGEIWWECLSSGNYKFHARLYQECYGIDYNVTETIHTTVPGLPSFPVNLMSITDITPVCNNDPVFPHIFCDNVTGSNQGGVKEWLYESGVIALPSTTPPANGWVFSLEICNRNPCTNISNSTSLCARLRAIMFSYNAQPVSNCYDNAPYFVEKPAMVLSTGYSHQIVQNVIDKDGDSLSFSWGQPWEDINQPITYYNPGYSYTSPLPGNMQNPNNIPATINPVTGLLTFTSFTQGAFVICIKISAWRNGMHLTDVFRELQVVLVTTAPNLPPFVGPPFPDNPVDQWCDTVQIGDIVSIGVYAYDTGLLNDTVNPQSVVITANGQFFGAGFTDSLTGCPVPPCATLSITPPLSNPVLAATEFKWQVTMDHLGYQNEILGAHKSYSFNFGFADDYCPVPATVFKTLRLIVRNPQLPPPVLTSYEFDSLSGVLITHWDAVEDTLGIFSKYLIYYKNAIAAEFQLIDSLMDINQNTYTFLDTPPFSNWFWLYMKTRTVTNISIASNVITNYSVGSPELLEGSLLLTVAVNQVEKAINLTGRLSKPSVLTFQLVDCLGVIHLDRRISLSGGEFNCQLPYQTKSTGLFLYRISGENVSTSGKLLLMK